jgi:branched-chain amino acid transport system permease protein
MNSLPCGTRNYSYAQDMAIVRTRTQWFLLVIFLVFLFTLPLYLGNYWLSVANLIGITIIAVTGLNILVGYCGQLSIGHAGFMAIGAYTSAIISGKLGLPFPLAFISAGLMAGAVGLIFGMPSVRVKGFYLAITSIAAQFIILYVINHWTSLTGGFNGISVPYASLGGFQLRSEASQFFLIAGITVICIFLAKNIARTRVGRAFVAIRDNDLAAEVMGVNLFRYKILAFFIGCFLAGIAGSLLAHWTGSISSENFSFLDSILFIGMIIVGGLGTTLGPILGVIAPLLFGLVIILFLILEPRGISHRWNLFKASYRLWPFSY